MFNRINRRAAMHRALSCAALLPAILVGDAGNASAEKPAVSRVAIKRAQMPVPVRSLTLRDADGEPVPVNAIAMNSRTGNIAVAGDDETIRLLDSSTMQWTKKIGSHRDRIRTLAFDAEGKKLVSAGNDGQLIVWDATDDFRVRQRMSGTPALARVCFAPTTNEIAAVGFDNEVFLIGGSDRGSSRPKKLTCQCRDLRVVSYRDDGQMIAVAGRSGDLHLFDANTGNMVLDQPIHQGRIHDAAFARQSNLLVTVGDDGHLCVFDTRRGKIVTRERVATGSLFSIAVISSQLVAVAGSDNDIRIVNIDEGSVVRTLTGHRGSVPTLAVGDGYLFSGGFDATLRRWSIENLQPDQQRIAEGNGSGKK